MRQDFWDKVRARRKPTIAYVPRTRKWICTAYNTAEGIFISGQAAKPETAFNAYRRKLKWHQAGRPGAGYRGQQ